MSKKPIQNNHVQRPKQARARHRDQERGERRQVWLSAVEIDELLLLLVSFDKGHLLIKYLSFIRRQFNDDCLKLRELEARVKANAFWEEDKGTIALEVKKVKDKQKSRHRKATEQIACLTPEQMKEVVKEMEKLPKPVEENGQSKE